MFYIKQCQHLQSILNNVFKKLGVYTNAHKITYKKF